MSTIIIHENSIRHEIFFLPGANLLQVLRSSGFGISAPCGGHGICGKCSVRLRIGCEEKTVLACETVLHGDCAVFLRSQEADLSWNDSASCSGFEEKRSGFGAAVDLGTTTVAINLYDLSDGRCLGSRSEWNVQKAYGADVIARIGWCIDHPEGLAELSSAIRRQIDQMLDALLHDNGLPRSALLEVFLAGNTVMQHLFSGLSPASIAAAPFIPTSFFADGKPVLLDGTPVFLSPCVAGYVGGDITAGLLGIGLHQKDTCNLFIDVGTNGEMALGGKEGFVTCAVASGPAFEGAGICCGMSAAYGAVSRVELVDGALRYEVLGGGEAEGLCGSGLLDLTACLLDLGFIDESGCLEENEDGEAIFYLTDRVYLTQRDVRQLQLAKAAVCAGIRLLMEAQKLRFSQLDRLYLAGGFGNRLRPESAIRIGMLPEEMRGRIIPCGNASLSGAEKALGSAEARAQLHEIRAHCTYLELSSDPNFNSRFVEEMSFPDA